MESKVNIELMWVLLEIGMSKRSVAKVFECSPQTIQYHSRPEVKARMIKATNERIAKRRLTDETFRALLNKRCNEYRRERYATDPVARKKWNEQRARNKRKKREAERDSK